MDFRKWRRKSQHREQWRTILEEEEEEGQEQEAVLVTIQVFLDVTSCKVVNSESGWQIQSTQRNFPIDFKL